MKSLFLFCFLLNSTIALSETVINGHHTGLIHDANEVPGLGRQLGITHVHLEGCDKLPDEFDLRDLGVVPPTRDQGSCGSCWAFSKTASLESSVRASGGDLFDLSEQQLVSCDKNNYGCNGGNLDSGDKEFQVTRGQALESDFPYKASGVRCKSPLKVAAKGTDWVRVGASGRRATVEEVKCALFKSHTIPWITVAAGSSWGSFPSDSAGLHTRCGGLGSSTNHAVGLVGWATVEGKTYFKMRNSWGASWGSDANRPGMQKGYGLMQLGCDNLGEEVAYILTSAMPCIPPKVRLPISVTMMAGDEIELAVKPQEGVSYAWFLADTKVGQGPMLAISPSGETVYKVVGKNYCGQAESSVKVIVN